jgi:hypothetical protein
MDLGCFFFILLPGSGKSQGEQQGGVQDGSDGYFGENAMKFSEGKVIELDKGGGVPFEKGKGLPDDVSRRNVLKTVKYGPLFHPVFPQDFFDIDNLHVSILNFKDPQTVGKG